MDDDLSLTGCYGVADCGLEDTMTKTIEEQIAEAREDVAFVHDMWDPACLMRDTERRAYDRLAARAASRLATLEAVRDGRMVPAWATVRVNEDAEFISFGADGCSPEDEFVMRKVGYGGRLTVLRGYAHVPTTQVHEVEADSEAVS